MQKLPRFLEAANNQCKAALQCNVMEGKDHHLRAGLDFLAAAIRENEAAKPDQTKFTIEQFAENEEGWDTDTGRPGVMYVANAIQAWSVFNHARSCTVKDAAEAFNLKEEDVRTAIEAHPWMFITGEEELIEHEGE